MSTEVRPSTLFVPSILRELRAEMGRQHVSAAQLARLSGLPYGRVVRAVNGRRALNVVEFAVLCDALGIDPPDMARRAEAALEVA